jgi:uncharacterized membrane protein YkvA (DUF1232 family)
MAVLDADKMERLEKLFEGQIDDVDEKDVGDALDRGRKKIDSVAEKMPDVMKDIWDDLLEMWNLLNDYYHERYTDIPWRSIAAIVAALLYFISPVDLIPDVIPVIGLVDDAFVLTLAAKLIRDDIERYREWRRDDNSLKL